MNIVAFCVLSIAGIICGSLALICGIIVKIALFMGSSQEKFSAYDEQTKLAGAIAGVLFAFFLVIFILKPRRTYSDK